MSYELIKTKEIYKGANVYVNNFKSCHLERSVTKNLIILDNLL